MSLVEKVYRRSPIPVQQLMVSVYGAAWYAQRFGKHYRRKVAELRRNDRLSAEEFRRIQLEKLNSVLRSAQGSPHYRAAFERAGLTLPLRSIGELSRLPTLSKQTLRLHSRALLTRKPPLGAKVFRSSGTTGTPTEIHFTHEFHQTSQAYFQARLRDWAGIGENAKRAMFGVRKVCEFDQQKPPFWRSSPIERLTYYSIYHMSPALLPAYVEHLARTKPEIIMGYPSALNVLARFVIDRGASLHIPAAITTSETVTPEIRAAVEKAFRGRLIDQYGAVENCMFAAQCEHGSYHLSPERGIVEILDGDEPCPPGKEGRVVVTGLENDLQPLIRYEIGDVAFWAEDQSCACGRSMPILGGVQGRYEDYCVLPDGRRVLRFDTVFKGVTSIAEAQVVQTSATDFTINVVPTVDFSESDRRKLQENFALHAGEARVEIVTLPDIPRTSSGKFRAVINRTLRAPDT